MTPALPLDSAQVSETLRPLEQATMLPPAAFTDQAVLDWELEEIFCAGWICVGHVSQVSEPGRFLMREIGRDSVVVIGGEDGRPRAFHNVCRHRGARLSPTARGASSGACRCPYHAWSYDLDGALRASPHMDGVENFDPSCNGLVPVRLSTIGGLLLVDLSGDAPDPPSTSAACSSTWSATGMPSSAAPARSTTSSPRTGRASSRTTTSACTARGSSGAERAQQLHERRGDGGRRCLVWRIDDADRRRCGDDGERRRPRDRQATDPRALEEELRSILYVALFPNALVSFHPTT
jgi:Phenylpropionate dioxygenase and related ring-hydroxylating dioxygenases, large terminal subunit